MSVFPPSSPPFSLPPSLLSDGDPTQGPAHVKHTPLAIPPKSFFLFSEMWRASGNRTQALCVLGEYPTTEL